MTGSNLKPGSRWLLPVTFDCDDGDAFFVKSEGSDGNLYIPVYHSDAHTLIPADRITELEAEVGRLKAERDSEADFKVLLLDAGWTVAKALNGIGYPVSDLAWENAAALMSREARAMHLAAVQLLTTVQDERGTP